MSDTIFIIGCPRSGTTAYTRLLDFAPNADVHIELPPRLRIESRDLFKGKLHEPELVLRNAKQSSIIESQSNKKIFGDKNPCYLPFIPYLNNVWDCKIVFLVRDGRDVVRSLLDWHKFKSKNVFAMHEDDPESIVVEPAADPWDYSRLRPNPGEEHYNNWSKLSRFQKCAWYWSEFNSLGMDYLSKIDNSRWKCVDVTHAGVDDVRELYEFLNLRGFDEESISKNLTARINSLQERTGQKGDAPHWSNWTDDQMAEFELYAGAIMTKLNYGIK